MKRTYLIIAVLMIIFTVYEVVTSYAKYVTSGTATVSKQAGAWVIEVNDDDISSRASTRQFEIDALTVFSNNNVLESKIAPGSNGYFEIVVDPTGSSVAIRYDVTIDLTGMAISNQMHFEKARLLVNGNEVDALVRTAANTYSGTISLADVKAGNSVTSRFYIIWENDSNGTYDQDDSQLGVLRTVSNFSLPISVEVSQYSGEQLVAYTSN